MRRYVDVIDGIRALAVLLVAWFHLWQQSWIMPIGFGINLDWLPRTAYVMVDMLLLISGFCLFLPHARAMVYGEALPNQRLFFQNRAARILPSYLFALAVMLILFNLPMGAYTSPSAMFKDLSTHLTFTHTFFEDTYIATKLSTSLWTLAIEVQFYLIFPLLAAWFRKKPLLVYSAMTLLSLGFTLFISLGRKNLPIPMLINQLPAFLGVYANGMLGALIFVSMHKANGLGKYSSLFFTGVALLCLYMYWLFMQDLCRSPEGQLWQVQNRYPLSLLFAAFVLSAAFSAKGFRFLLSNRIMRFLSAISFNFYIWHQFLAVKLKELHIPPWSGENPPNQTGDTVWMWQYFLLCWATAFAAATLTTYLIEKPAAAWLKKRWGQEKHAAGASPIS